MTMAGFATSCILKQSARHVQNHAVKEAWYYKQSSNGVCRVPTVRVEKCSGCMHAMTYRAVLLQDDLSV